MVRFRRMQPSGDTFFSQTYRSLVHQPNGRYWWHNLPMPNGDRIAGANPDRNLQHKMWEGMRIDSRDGLRGKRVLDVGANDGFFTVAAALAGAEHVTAINSEDWPTYPANLAFAAKQWGTAPEVVVADFLTHAYRVRYDVIIFLGVLYHLEDVFQAMRTLRGALIEGGLLYVETQLSAIVSPLPLYEAASDIYPTVAPQDKGNLGHRGISNLLFPNEAAMHNLAYSYDFDCVNLGGSEVAYTRENPTRGLFMLTKH